MAIFRWPGGLDPFAPLRYMQREMERMSRSIFGESRRVGGGNYPPVNVFEGPEDIIVQCELPGVKREDLDLSVTGETLVVKGAKKPPAEEEKLVYQRRERGSGDFSRTVVLPEKIDADRIEASLSEGILTIRVPKAEAAKPKTIRVK